VDNLPNLINYVLYNVLFLISAGNQTAPISLGINRTEFEALSADELQKNIPTAYDSKTVSEIGCRLLRGQ
jgi:hypothetical protein